MTNKENAQAQPDDPGQELPAPDPIGAPRLLPGVAFGVRVAALAGLIAATGTASAGLGGVGAGFGPELNGTGCCPPVLD